MTTKYTWGAVLIVLATAVNAMALLDTEFIIEGGTDATGTILGQHRECYAETGTGWYGTSAHSKAAGLTVGIQGRFFEYATYPSNYGTFTFTPQATGPYEVYVTWGRSTNNNTLVDHILEFDDPANPGGKTTNTWVLNQNQAGGLYDIWTQLTIDTTTQFTMTAGQPYTLTVKKTQTGGTGARVMCDAVKYIFKGHGCTDVPDVGGFQGALIAGDTSVTVTGVDPEATKVSVYANGAKIGQNTSPGGATTVTVPVTALISGRTITATQNKVVGDPALDTESCLPATGPVVDDCAQIPAVAVGSVVLVGDTTVTVTGVSSSATAVTVYSNGSPIGTNNAPGGNTTVTVGVTALVADAKITATQRFRTLNGCAPADGPVVGSCEQIPAIAVAGLVDAGRTQVRVTGVSTNATAVKVYANDGTTDTLIGTNNAPGGNSTVLVTVTGLVLGQTIKATQVIRIEGCVPATGRRVMASWVIEDFEDGVVDADNPFPSGKYRTWYDVGDGGYAATIAASGTLFGSKAMKISDNGYQNGMYAIYEQVIPATGTYHIKVSMLADESGTGANLAWMSTYQVGVLVNGQHRVHPASLAGVTTETGGVIGDYTPLTENQDGVGIDGAMKLAYTGSFSANAGDSLLIVFSTNVASYTTAGASGTSAAGYPAMWVDDITLGEGEPPCVCQRVGAVAINTGPLEAGETTVTVSGVSTSPPATMVTVYTWDGGDNWTKLGEVVPSAATANVPVAPLVKGKTLVATQTLSICSPAQDMEGCKGKVGPVVGLGKNTGLLMSLGIRETGGTGPVGADGGMTGNIEWLGPPTTIGGAPQGKPVPVDPDWQTVTFTPGVDKVLSFNAGNGILDGSWGVLEHLAFAIDTTTPNTGRYTVYIDNIYSGTTLLTDFESYAPAAKVIFAQPTYSGTTAANLITPPNVAEVSEEQADGAGTKSLKVSFQFVDVQQKRWLRLTSAKMPTAQELPNPLIALGQPITMRVLLKGAKDCGAVFADRDADNDVDQADFGEFQKCYTGTTTGIPAGCECFDRTGDEKIDAADLIAFTNCWSGPAIAADPNCDE
ncbi:MAG TPA: hypothetical protein PKY77_26590 [Phycisphaerae bacterium]|nr:hypothetical protein [Phycisphaerae bacterium]HRY71503.1 hypothetical protein [Phycisphaerae bacterium]HSA30092.1 hypothetical protein [Phycisphaerae bacterium]